MPIAGRLMSANNPQRRLEDTVTNLKTQLAVLVLFLLCLFTGAYGQFIPGGHGANLGKASPVQSQPATSGPIVQEHEAAKPPTYTVLYAFTGGADGAAPTVS